MTKRVRFPRDTAGFTLLEVTIALAILGVAVAAVFDLMRVGLYSIEASEGYSRAVFHAHSKMGELLVQMPLEAGNESGKFEDGFSFETIVTEYEFADLVQSAGDGFEQAQPTAQTFFLEVVIHIPRQKRMLRLQSLRTVPYQES